MSFFQQPLRISQSVTKLIAFIGWTVLFVFAFSSALSAQENQPQEPARYALLIGVAKYSHSAMNHPDPLLFPEADAQAIAQLLKESGYQVDLLLGSQATGEAIRQKLQGLRQQGDSDGIVLVGLFGHGVEIETTDASGEVSREGCFCPYDTAIQIVKDSRGNEIFDNNRQPLTEPDPSTLVRLSELMKSLKLSPAGSRVVLADCCRTSPNRARGRSFGGGFRAQDLPDNTSILFGCAPNEQAFEHNDWGHGAFTKCLLDEIRDLSLGGGVDTAQLAARLKRSVPQLVSAVSPRSVQTPKLFATDAVDLQLKSEDPDYLRGRNLYYGFGTLIDQLTAVHHLRLAANRGHALAAASMALLSLSGNGGLEPDKRQAQKYASGCFDLLTEMATSGNAEAQYLLSGLYKNGLGTTVDLKKCLALLTRSAEQGYSPAKMFLGMEYHLGDSLVEMDHHQAITWYRQAASEGLAVGQYALAALYLSDSPLKNEREGRRWLEKAAAQNEPNSFSMLGMAYRDGVGGDVDFKEAERYLRKAANFGDSGAQYALAMMLYSGDLPKNDEESFVLMKRAAERQHLAAQLTLATFYGTGFGTAMNNAEAISWYRRVLQHPEADQETKAVARQCLSKLGVR